MLIDEMLRAALEPSVAERLRLEGRLLSIDMAIAEASQV
jgi:hypothetical protein